MTFSSIWHTEREIFLDEWPVIEGAYKLSKDFVTP
jgi:hypothetical protein